MEHGIDVTGPIAPGQQAAVEAVLRQRNLPVRQRERLEMVKAAWLGADISAIAHWSGRTPRTVRRWLVTFREGGIDALAVCRSPIGHPGPMRRIWRRWSRRSRRHRAPSACRSMSGVRGG